MLHLPPHRKGRYLPSRGGCEMMQSGGPGLVGTVAQPSYPSGGNEKCFGRRRCRHRLEPGPEGTILSRTVSVVVPCFNESEVISSTHGELDRCLGASQDFDF